MSTTAITPPEDTVDNRNDQNIKQDKTILPRGVFFFCDPFKSASSNTQGNKKKSAIVDVASDTASLNEEEYASISTTLPGGVPRSVLVPTMAVLSEDSTSTTREGKSTKEVGTTTEQDQPSATLSSSSNSNNKGYLSLGALMFIVVLAIMGNMASLDSNHSAVTWSQRFHDHLVKQHVIPAPPVRRIDNSKVSNVDNVEKIVLKSPAGVAQKEQRKSLIPPLMRSLRTLARVLFLKVRAILSRGVIKVGLLGHLHDSEGPLENLVAPI